jgi:WD40 repeat protein
MNVAYHQDPGLITGISNPLFLTDTEGKTWHKVTDGYVNGVLWSPDGKKLLFGKKDPQTQIYQLWYYDLYSGEIKNLGLNTTPEKAVWGSDNQTIYVAVSSAGVGSGLTTDVFYKINLGTSERKSYDPGSMQLDGREMFISQDNTKVFFRNAQDGGLYYLELSQ